MTAARKTTTFGSVALALLTLTWATALRVKTPGVFADRGEVLFPQFRDPNAAASVEVIEFDPQSATARRFKVQNRSGRWTIPSQHNYPADAKDRLAQTAAAVIALRKDDFATDNVADYERCGVLDPMDTTLPGLNGRGNRLLVRGEHDEALADIIIGNQVEGHPGYRYVRQPGQRRVYTSNTDELKISTAFGDWIERDLLEVNTEDIDAINLRNYSLDRTSGRVDPGATLLLQKTPDGNWTMAGLAAGEQLDLAALDALLRNLASLRISGVLPKPPGITALLSRDIKGATAIMNDDKADLARKGFYLTGNGQLVSNRGEVVVRTRQGVFYTLRFGDIAPDTEVSAAVIDQGTETGVRTLGTPENRYLFVMADFDANSASTPARAAEGADNVRLLRARFAPWYYVIAADSFAKIRLQRSGFVRSPVSGARRAIP